jgi:hypothetical protein
MMKYIIVIPLVIGLATGPLSSRAAAEEGEPAGKVGRSSKLAFLMSLIVPGLGELYYGAEKRGIAFMAAEAGMWVTYASWNNRGSSIERDFRSFADLHWSEARYQNWDRNTPESFYMRTERLPSKQMDIQQYYELIGKYDQFVFGWDDGKDAQGRPVGTDYSIHPRNVTSANRLSYEVERNRSNRYFKRSSRILGLVVVNHLVSAIDASVHARDAKVRLWVDADMIEDAASNPVPTMRLNVRF